MYTGQSARPIPTGQMLHHDTCTVQNEHLTAQGACRVSCEPPLPSPSTKPHRDGSRAGGLQLPVANGSSSCNRQGQVSRISGVVPLIPPPTADGLVVDQPALSTPSISPVLAGVRCLRNQYLYSGVAAGFCWICDRGLRLVLCATNCLFRLLGAPVGTLKSLACVVAGGLLFNADHKKLDGTATLRSEKKSRRNFLVPLLVYSW